MAKKISKLVILGNLVMPGHTPLKWSNMKKPLTFICRQKIKLIFNNFLELLQRYCKLVLGTLGMPDYANPKWYYQLAESFLCLFAGKKSTSPLMLFWRYCKDIQTSYFAHFGHNWLRTPKMIVSICGSFSS